MGNAGELDARDVARGGIDALEVPDGLARFTVEIGGKETAAIGLVKDAGEAPGAVRKGLHVENINDEDIAWLGAFDFKGPAEIVDPRQVDVVNVVGVVGVFDLAAGPFVCLDLGKFEVRLKAS